MSERVCKLNNMRMQALRKEFAYQAAIIDLAMAGLIDKQRAERLLGYQIPERMTLPEWYGNESASRAKRRPQMMQEQPEA